MSAAPTELYTYANTLSLLDVLPFLSAEGTVDIVDAGRHPFARRVDHRRAFGNRKVAAADRLDPPVRQPDRATVDAPALAVEHGRAPDHRDVRRRRPIGGGTRVRRYRHPLFIDGHGRSRTSDE